MKYDPEIHHRRSIRLKGYNYSQAGTYFVTICTHNRECIFGTILDDKMRLNDVGQMVQASWEQLPQRFPIELDAYVVMPNHFHAIVIIVGAPLVGAPDRAGTRRAGTRPAPTMLGDIIGAFKSITTNECIRGVREFNWPHFDKRLWQRNYYEHVIRNEEALNRIREYILNNPLRWMLDRENPECQGEDEFDRWLDSDRRSNDARQGRKANGKV